MAEPEFAVSLDAPWIARQVLLAKTPGFCLGNGAMHSSESQNHELAPWREKMWRVIFEHDTAFGKLFDVVLLIGISLSVVVVMLDSVESINLRFNLLLKATEWVLTILFTIEYVCRLLCVRRPLAYARSFYGIIDLISILPTYLSLLFVGPHYLAVVRILRLLRLFRVFKMVRYMGEANVILTALRASRPKITVFLFGVLSLVTIMGTLMYLIEGKDAGFTSIPRSLYWAIVTVTTVGYGDIKPVTPLGQTLAAFGMIAGYAIIAVPTGIVGVEIQNQMKRAGMGLSTRACVSCGRQGHALDAKFCRHCGEELEEEKEHRPNHGRHD